MNPPESNSNPTSRNPLEDFLAHEVHEDDGEVVWLISYADLMTLLFTLFVMLYSSLVKNGDMNDIKRVLASHFGTQYEHGIKNLNELILQQSKSDPKLSGVQTRETFEGVEVTFTAQEFFDSGRAEVKDDVRESFLRLAQVLKAKAPSHHIRVEGHTDDRPISRSNWPSNWELASARAATIVRLFEQVGFAQNQLTAIGYGQSRPKVANRTPAGVEIAANMALNRRVVVTAIAPLAGRTEK